MKHGIVMVRLPLLLSGIALLPALAAAQERAPAEPDRHGPAPDAEMAGDEDIVVTGQRPPGSVIGDIAPELVLSPADIRTYGVSSITDLIAELGPQTTSGRGGRPVVLLNGKRISSFAEIRDIPTEAILRAEILPEEVALKYGYRADQKVVNIVLRPRFRTTTAELTGAAPTEGGQSSASAESSLLRINKEGRFNLALKYQRSSALYEDERDIVADTPRRPYDVTGNITAPVYGDEIDPALSALAGQPVTAAGVPAAAAQGAQPLTAFNRPINTTDTGRYRTLLPQTDSVSMNAVLNRTIFGDVSATVNGTLSYDESDSAQGLATASIRLPGESPFSPFAGETRLYRYLDEIDPRTQQSKTVTGHLGFTLSGAAKGWQWNATGNYDRTEIRTRTRNGVDIADFQAGIDALDPTLNPFAPIPTALMGGPLIDRARSVEGVGNIQLVANGTLARLPAGPVSATVKLGGEFNDLDAHSTRAGMMTDSDLSRDIASGQISLDLPLASRKRGFIGPLGELSANVNLAYDRLSDFGGLTTLGYGLNWTPIPAIRLIASVTEDENAPTMQQLGNPTIATSGVRIFDYVRGETVDVIRISGGNPTLQADDRRVFKLGATIRPFTGNDLTLSADYVNSRVRDAVAAFPTPTAAIEAAFPDRFVRDASGQLVSVDSRPINFTRQNSEELRWGINFSKQLSSPPAGAGNRPMLRELARDAGDGPPAERPAGSDADRPRGAGFGPGGGGFGRGPGGRGTRMQFAVYHTVHLREEILVRPDGPMLDLLDGDAIGSTGGQPRHEVEAQAGLTHNGLGARLSAAWRSGTDVNGGPDGSDSLHFSSLTTINLRFFADLGQQAKLVSAVPFLRGSRLTLSVTNLFNERMRVRDADGITPVSYQPDYLDPLGRSIRISFRKLFFPPRPSGPRS
ncbi:MAG: TonB-dependent receptor [Sphingomonas sp.]|nr:TonB-dependent receptor [Sphingomonas sp.]MDX3885321.1 TonB-dependent receptor [Sphingomonas sp.]